MHSESNKLYENINHTLKKYILRYGENDVFNTNKPSNFTIIYRVDKYLSYGADVTVLYYLHNGEIQKSNSNLATILNNKELETEIIYQSDNLEDVIEAMKIYIESKKYNI